MSSSHRSFKSITAAALAVGLTSAAQAAQVQLKVTVENRAPANSVAFAPLRVGFNSGTYDSFNAGGTASAAIALIAESGSGSAWFPAFAAADPTATLGTVGTFPPPLLPGVAASEVFSIDTDTNPYFTFAAMVVPSNDSFIGNDSPTQYKLFDNAGNLLITSITQSRQNIWDAGSEVTDPATAAFLVGGDASGHAAENGVVAFSFTQLTAFDGLTTGANYVFDSQLASDNTEIYRISFAPVPEPETYALMLAGLAVLTGVRKRAAGR
ncbi:MAG: PEP-CTERM sorting domain-containing protein [Burkholderiaceae bacterium]|nr:PEP-CTERM sorting domain-containing protein [Burkholderiaceae bacterium]